ncbi:hypothetical protein ACN27F_18280 [Solwaraspora sp. WMMB335]|uniref:hypothetical protein n=1 Tax=Solwaraspora sp. WMMB335 TaxID=3404118 RepID=UPI003B9239AA
MKVRDSVTTAGGARSNEDRVSHAGSLAWVIDGATDLYDDSALPAERDGVWLVDLIGALLAEAGTDGYQGSGADLAGGEHAGGVAVDDSGGVADASSPPCSSDAGTP